MELSMSGNALKTFARSITCLARIGNELVLQASPSQLALHTLNSSRSAYQSVTYKSCFFDVYRVSGAQAQCSVLLKALCSVFRTPIASIDQLTVHLSDVYASKVQWTLECSNGMKKTYWITCNVEPDIQHLSLDRTRFPSNFVIRPRDMNRLLANFQSSLQEITIIATEPIDSPSDVASEIGGKAVELRSYIDPTKESDSSLYTQLWIDPAEEFVQYSHNGDPVDVTFSVKELKAFLTFCEGCEIDIHLFFQKSGEPILMAPRFGLDDGSNSNFDATLVLATMLTSQLHGGNPSESVQVAGAGNGQTMNSRGSRSQQEKCRPSASEHPSDHTRIWSDLSGSAVKISGAVEERQGQRQGNLNASEERNIQRIRSMHITKDAPTRQNGTAGPTMYPQYNFASHYAFVSQATSLWLRTVLKKDKISHQEGARNFRSITLVIGLIQTMMMRMMTTMIWRRMNSVFSQHHHTMKSSNSRGLTWTLSSVVIACFFLFIHVIRQVFLVSGYQLFLFLSLFWFLCDL